LHWRARCTEAAELGVLAETLRANLLNGEGSPLEFVRVQNLYSRHMRALGLLSEPQRPIEPPPTLEQALSGKGRKQRRRGL
jgi:hypothetical protein